MPRKMKTAAAGKAAQPQCSSELLEQLVPGPVTPAQFEDIFHPVRRPASTICFRQLSSDDVKPPGSNVSSKAGAIHRRPLRDPMFDLERQRWPKLHTSSPADQRKSEEHDQSARPDPCFAHASRNRRH